MRMHNMSMSFDRLCDRVWNGSGDLQTLVDKVFLFDFEHMRMPGRQEDALASLKPPPTTSKPLFYQAASNILGCLLRLGESVVLETTGT